MFSRLLADPTLTVMTPLFVLCGGALLVLLLGTMKARMPRFMGMLSLATLGGAAMLLGRNFSRMEGEYLGGQLTFDPFGAIAAFLFLAIAFLVIMMSFRTLEGIESYSEYFALLLFAVFGMTAMLWTHDLLILFIALETLTIASFILTGYFRKEKASTEAALKYFLTGAFSAAIYLLGMVMLFGTVGSTRFSVIAQYVDRANSSNSIMFWVGGALVMAGLLFKMAAVPFHAWSPDVYQGAPTPVTAFLAVGSKAAATLVLIRVLYEAFGNSPLWTDLLWWVAVATMFLGNLAALAQVYVKRMLAYSSIAHAGYLLIGFVAASQGAVEAIVIYLIIYAAMNIGALAAVSALESRQPGGIHDVSLQDLKGKGFSAPFLGLVLTVAMLSLGGIPPTSGFFAKFSLFGEAVAQGHIKLVVLAVLSSAISLFYYLRVVVNLYMKPEIEGESSVVPPMDWKLRFVLLVALLGMLIFGLLPSSLVDFAALATFL